MFLRQRQSFRIPHLPCYRIGHVLSDLPCLQSQFPDLPMVGIEESLRECMRDSRTDFGSRQAD